MGNEAPIQSLDYFGVPPNRPKRPNDPESARWRWRRISYRCGLGVIFAIIAFYAGPRFIVFVRLRPYSQTALMQIAQTECAPVVRALKLYQRDNGRFPEDIYDLFPRYLSKIPDEGGYSSSPSAIFTYVCPTHQVIQYDLDPRSEGWKVFSLGGADEGLLPLPIVTMGPLDQPMTRP
jgi:hypothetical protein